MAEFIYKNNNVYIKSNSFDLRQTLDCGQSFRFKKDENDVWKGIAKRRIITLYKEDEYIVIENMSEDEFKADFFEYFTFDIDYSAIKESLSTDDVLRKAIEFSPGIRILKQEKFETVCSFIFSQNNNIPRIKGIIERFCENFGKKIDDENFAFPSAERIANLEIEDLAPIRAGFRAKYIIDAAKKIYSGEVNLENLENLPLEKAREELMKIKGVGPKVADCVLLFSCKQLSAFPQDVWIKKVMAELYPQGLPNCTAKVEGIAQQYLFDYARSIKL